MRITITGEGIISAIGCNKNEVLESLREKRSGIAQPRFLPTSHKDLPVGEVPLSNEALKERLGIDPGREISRTTMMAVLAVREAVQDAGLDDNYLKGKRITLVSGTTVGGMDVTEHHFLSQGAGAADPHGDNSATGTNPTATAAPDSAEFIRSHDCGGNTRQIAEFFDFITGTATISTACSSAANAIIVGAEMLRNDEADIIIAGGSEALSLFHLNGFNSLMILDHEPCRPFDATRAGLNLGEGAAYIILEKEADSKARGHNQYAYLRGYGNACDAFHQTASSPDGEGAFRAMSQALEMAGMTAGNIDYINAHGTATPNNDETELAALKRVCGETIPPTSSTKAFTGHTTSASGSIEAIICLLAMERHFIPANLNWHVPMPGFVPSPGAEGVNVQTAMCNSFGFGGNDSSLIISTQPGEPLPELPQLEDNDIIIAATSEITDEEDLKQIKEYIAPMEARRMGRLLKASLLTSLRVLKEAGIETPDAIVTGTAYGCVENSEKILLTLCEEGESSVKPTLFMQSTHNTMSGNIAIQTKCHGYNITYSHGKESLELALKDARRLLQSGKYKTVLVGMHDESTQTLRDFFVRAGLREPEPIYSKSLLLTLKK